MCRIVDPFGTTLRFLRRITALTPPVSSTLCSSLLPCCAFGISLMTSTRCACPTAAVYLSRPRLMATLFKRCMALPCPVLYSTRRLMLCLLLSLACLPRSPLRGAGLVFPMMSSGSVPSLRLTVSSHPRWCLVASSLMLTASLSPLFCEGVCASFRFLWALVSLLTCLVSVCTWMALALSCPALYMLSITTWDVVMRLRAMRVFTLAMGRRNLLLLMLFHCTSLICAPCYVIPLAISPLLLSARMVVLLLFTLASVSFA